VSDQFGEWFEIHNTTGATIDLEGLVISDADGESITVVGSLPVPAGGYVVLGANADLATNGGVPVDYEYVQADFQLGNNDDEVILSNAFGVLDAVYYDGGPAFPDPNGASMSLDPTGDHITNDDGAMWCEGVDSYGDGDFGTPGAANPSCAGDTG